MHILSVKDFDYDFLSRTFCRTDEIKHEPRRWCNALESYHILASVFFEPSTRTRFSFEAAMLKLGGKVISTEDATVTSSRNKGESLEDMIRTISLYSDVIAYRHPEGGSAKRASQFSKCPLINCGDGNQEHPIQNLIDFYTILKNFQKKPDEIKFENLEKKKVLLYGDLENSRTMHGLSHLLNKFGVEIIYGGNTLKSRIDATKWMSDENIMKHLPDIDVFYMTRPQKERGTTTTYGININNKLLQLMKKDAIVLHPLPKWTEIHSECDSDPRAKYWEQAENGLWIRMSILYNMLNKLRDRD